MSDSNENHCASETKAAGHLQCYLTLTNLNTVHTYTRTHTGEVQHSGLSHNLKNESSDECTISIELC